MAKTTIAFAKRHYEALALVMQGTKPGAGYARELVNWQHIRNDLADMLARDNGRFDRERFIRACEPGANVRARTGNPPVQDVKPLRAVS